MSYKEGFQLAAHHAVEIPFKGNAIEITGIGGKPFAAMSHEPKTSLDSDPNMGM